MQMDSQITSLYLNKNIYDSFKKLETPIKISLSDFVGYCLYKYVNDSEFQKEVLTFLQNDYSTGIIVKNSAGKRFKGGIDLNKQI